MANPRSFAFFQLLFVLTVSSTVIDGVAAQHSMPQARVVGGTNAAANSAPYIVSFHHNNEHYCAGSILNAHWVLTAAHCLGSRLKVLSTTLIAGSINVAGSAKTTQRRQINYYVVNDLYNGGTAPYDIGLVYTKSPFTWSVAVQPVSLPANSHTPTGSATLYGWGSTSKTSVPSYPNILQVAKNIPIIPLSSCEKALGAKGNDVHDTNLCTGPLTGGVGICNSDSGGPLVQKHSNGQIILIGIVSWGRIPCGKPNSPSVYVKVSDFLSWIAKNQVVP